MMKLKAKTLVAALLAGGLLASTAWADVTEEERFSFELNDNGRFSLGNVNGDIVISGESGNRVEVIATKKAGNQEYLDEIEIIVEADSDLIRIDTELPKKKRGWFSGGDSGSVSYEVIVPNSANLDTVESVNGDILVGDVSGTVKISTVNGDLELTDLMGDASLESVNGDIDATFDRFGGGQRVDTDVVNGDITLYLPSNTDASVNIDTVNGDIDADDFGLRVSKGFVGKDLRDEIGSGSGKIVAETVNGDITLANR